MSFQSVKNEADERFFQMENGNKFTPEFLLGYVTALYTMKAINESELRFYETRAYNKQCAQSRVKR